MAKSVEVVVYVLVIVLDTVDVTELVIVDDTVFVTVVGMLLVTVIELVVVLRTVEAIVVVVGTSCLSVIVVADVRVLVIMRVLSLISERHDLRVQQLYLVLVELTVLVNVTVLE